MRLGNAAESQNTNRCKRHMGVESSIHETTANENKLEQVNGHKHKHKHSQSLSKLFAAVFMLSERGTGQMRLSPFYTAVPKDSRSPQAWKKPAGKFVSRPFQHYPGLERDAWIYLDIVDRSVCI